MTRGHDLLERVSRKLDQRCDSLRRLCLCDAFKKTIGNLCQFNFGGKPGNQSREFLRRSTCHQHAVNRDRRRRVQRFFGEERSFDREPTLLVGSFRKRPAEDF